MFRPSHFYLSRATALLQTLHDDKTTMYFLRIDATLKLIAGEQGAAVAVFERGLHLGSAIGDDQSQMNNLTNYAVSLFLQGEYTQLGRRSSELFALAQRCQNPQFVTSGPWRKTRPTRPCSRSYACRYQTSSWAAMPISSRSTSSCGSAAPC